MPHASPTLAQRIEGCLIGGAVGDALGAPIEFDSLATIRSRFGPAGVRGFVADVAPPGTITDDTQMTLFCAEALRATFDSHGLAPDDAPWAAALAAGYRRWYLTQTVRPAAVPAEERHGLLTEQRLFARRAPGSTCMAALARSRGSQPAVNDSKGCGTVMRVAPVGLLVAGAMASAPAGERVARAFRLGVIDAAVTHGHVTGQLSAGALAALIGELALGAPLDTATDAACAELLRHDGHAETLAALTAARSAADRAGPHDAAAVQALGGGWVAEEAFAISLYAARVALARHADDAATAFSEALCLAVNHGGDSDSTGAITGNILGARLGIAAVKQEWQDHVELGDLVRTMAGRLRVG